MRVANSENYTLIQVESAHEKALAQLYNWQCNETHRDKFCFTPVTNSVIPYTEEGFRQFVDAIIDVTGFSRYYMLYDLVSDTFYGTISYRDFNQRNYTAEISYYLPASERGKGLGEHMLRLFLKQLFSTDYLPYINKLQAETSAFNIGSCRILENCGFKLIGKNPQHYWWNGERFDQHIYVLLRDDYCAQQQAGC